MNKVLYVDDDKVALKLVKNILEGAGYVVLAFSDAVEAYEKMQVEPVDVVISDANMPGVSGFNFVRTIRSDEKFKDLPVALLTGRREKKDIQLGLQVGADDYIIKPIDPLILLSKVETLLKKRPHEVRAVQFAERSIWQDCTWDIDTKITSISERGLTVRSCLPAQVDSKVKVNSELFNQIGIEAPLLRVTGFMADPSAPNHLPAFFIQTSFVGLSDTELQRIRTWIITHVPKAS